MGEPRQRQMVHANLGPSFCEDDIAPLRPVTQGRGLVSEERPNLAALQQRVEAAGQRKGRVAGGRSRQLPPRADPSA